MSNVITLPQVSSKMTLDKLTALCRKRARRGAPVLYGLDPVTAMRCRALLYANTALSTLDDEDNEKARTVLERTAEAFLAVHDELAGLTWYSFPSTVRAARRETLRALDNAMTRAELRRISDGLSALSVQSRRKLASA